MTSLPILAVLAGLLALAGQDTTDPRLAPYLEILRKEGKDPAAFVVEKLRAHDLVILDDGLHTAVEPFEFLQRLVHDPAFQQLRPSIFLEVIPINKQRHLDAYLTAANDDETLLFPAFQDDANGRGFPYQTYFDLLRTARTINRNLPADGRFQVLAIGSPTFWREIDTPTDLNQFRKAMASYDYHMFTTIATELYHFRTGKKGVFVTNTRHAYKGIRRNDGQYFWNAGTFFTQRHPGKTYSIRCHNLQLSIQAAKPQSTGAITSLEGRERLEYKFVRTARGLWDSAFHANGDKPIAIPLANNVFGREPYLGNHQLDAAPGQTMHDAYDALIFLAPLDKLRQTAMTDRLYTPAFREELKRRYKILYSETQLADVLKSAGTTDLDGLFQRTFVAKPEMPLPELRNLGPIDEWKRDGAPTKTN
jgi:hypothetical protein